MTRLEQCREEINTADKMLAEAFEHRMNAVLEVAKYKYEHQMAVFDRNRELEVLKRAENSMSNKMYSMPFRRVIEQIMSEARMMETDMIVDMVHEKMKQGKPIVVGYQGVKGSFGNEALEQYFAGIPTVQMNYTRFEDLIKAVKTGEIRYGVLPIENSTTGGITEVYDLIRKYDCHIVGEKIIEIKQNLLALPGARIEDIKKVYSHSQGYEQSRPFFNKYPEMEFVPVFNTAEAAKMVSEGGDKTAAAVASEHAAQLYGLDILAEHINSNNTNCTRFFVLSKDFEHYPNADKITLVLAVKHEAGSLFRSLQTFHDSGLNMVNIESRPIEGRSWEYFFHIDLTGNIKDEVVIKALAKLSETTAFCKVLGNYKADTSDIKKG